MRQAAVATERRAGDHHVREQGRRVAPGRLLGPAGGARPGRSDQLFPTVPNGPVLLVDDIVYSRWTLTLSAWLLSKNGSGDVWPIALSEWANDQ